MTAEQERAAVVKWLQKEAADCQSLVESNVILTMAVGIQCGEHHKEGE